LWRARVGSGEVGRLRIRIRRSGYSWRDNGWGRSIYARGKSVLCVLHGGRVRWADCGDRLVAVLDLASDCLGCSKLVIRLDQELAETCTSEDFGGTDR
jgi:hypothetical protein